jgi:hypothetical protein
MVRIQGHRKIFSDDAILSLMRSWPQINSYMEFAEEVLPRIRHLGYNAIQIMAVQEHAYYGSFGYHVTNFFAVRSQSSYPKINTRTKVESEFWADLKE